MSGCCEELDSFFDGELSKDEADEFRAHFATCQHCQGALCGRVQEELIVRLADAREDRPRVFSIKSARRLVRRGRSVALAGMLAAAFMICWLVATRGPDRARPTTMDGPLAMTAPEEATSMERPLELVSSIEHRASGMRGSTPGTTLAPSDGVTLAHAGDVLRFTIRGERHRALWIYLGTRALVARCPGDPRCLASDSELSLEIPLEEIGPYWIVALGASEPILVPTGPLDTMLSAATSAGARFAMKLVTVN